MKKYTGLLIILLIGLNSCNKKDEGMPVVNGTILKKMINQSTSYEYDYYDNGDLKEYRIKHDGVTYNKYNFSYSADTIWEQVTVIYPNSDIFYLNNKYYNLSPDTIIAIRVEAPSKYTLYIFSEESCGPIQLLEYSNSTLLSEINYEYTDDNCSEILTRTNDAGNTTKIITIRDDKNSWESSAWPKYLRKGHSGNIIERSVYDQNDNLFIHEKFIYNYNIDNYPVSKSVDLPESDIKEIYRYY